MSIINTGAHSATLVPAPYWRQDRSRISWGAILAGAVVTVATALLLSMLGTAIGAGSIRATDPARYGTGAGIWDIINLVLSMTLGGYVTARLSGTHSHLDGELHGMTMWGLALLLGSWLLAHFSGVVGIAGPGSGWLVSPTVGGGGTISGILPPRVATVDRLQQSLGSSGDPTTMSREQIGAEITALVGRSLYGSLAESDRTRLVALVAAQSGTTKEEAARRVTQMENDAKASVAQAEQTTREAADALAHSEATAARALFTALVLGLLAALVGAWIGTRHKRVLHPAIEHSHDTLAPAYATRTVHETVGPSSVSVYDDTDSLVYQYLRGVSFPVNKQDLLRLARSSNAGSGLLHSIEGMPERTYANANEVLRALGMAH